MHAYIRRLALSPFLCCTGLAQGVYCSVHLHVFKDCCYGSGLRRICQGLCAVRARARPAIIRKTVHGPFLGPCCNHYFQDETEETRVLKGHVFWIVSTVITTVVNHQICLTICDLAKFPRPGWLAFPQVEVCCIKRINFTTTFTMLKDYRFPPII